MLNVIISNLYNVSLKLRGYREHQPDPLQEKRFKHADSHHKHALQMRIDRLREQLVDARIEREREEFRRALDREIDGLVLRVDRVMYEHGLC
jgi:hypothetical protein